MYSYIEHILESKNLKSVSSDISVMAFKFEATKLKGVYIITPQMFGDNRGYFMETYKKEPFVEAGIYLKEVDL